MGENVQQSRRERKEKARHGLSTLQAGGKKTVDGPIGAGVEKAVFNKAIGCRRQAGRWVCKVKISVLLQEFLDHDQVFFRFERAGGINQKAISGDKSGRVLKQIELCCLIALQLLFPPVPADIRVASGDGGAGAGRINKNTLKAGGAVTCEVLERGHTGCARGCREKSLEILAQFLISTGFGFNGGYMQIKLRHQLHEVAGLAAKTCTGIEIEASSDKGAEQQGGQLGGLILDLKKALVVAGKKGNRPLILRQNDRFGGERTTSAVDPLLVEQVAEQLFTDFGGMHPQDQARFAVIAGTDAQHLFFAEMPLPALRQPGRMIEAEAAGLIFSRCRQAGFAADSLPENAVAKTMEADWYFGRFQGIDSLIDGCRFRYAIKKKQLIEPGFQGMQDEGVDFMQGMAAEAADQELEILPLAQDPVDYVHGQTAIICCQSAFFGDAFKKGFEWSAGPLQSAECLNGCETGGFLCSLRFGRSSGHDDGFEARVIEKHILREGVLRTTVRCLDTFTVTWEFPEKQIESEGEQAWNACTIWSFTGLCYLERGG